MRGMANGQRRMTETVMLQKGGNRMETPGRIEDRRLKTQALFRAQWLRERRLSRALAVEAPEYWELGDWLQSIEASAASQREAGNMLKGDGVGGSAGCGQLTGCQVEKAMVQAILRRLKQVMSEKPGVEFTIAEVQGFKLVLDKLICVN